MLKIAVCQATAHGAHMLATKFDKAEVE